MPTYQFLLHTTGIRLETGDGDAPAVGFYTSRRASAPTSEEAYRRVMGAMDADPELEDIFSTAHALGLRPKTVAEETYVIPWWRAILPWQKPGLAFYPDDPAGIDGDFTP